MTYAVGLFQVKGHRTELAAASLCMAINEIHHFTNHRTLTRARAKNLVSGDETKDSWVDLANA